MKIEGLYDYWQDVKVNDLKEVTSKMIYKGGQNVFNPEGLFSEEIFGQTTEERKYRCGYIKLPVHVLNPYIAKNVISGVIRKMVYGETRCNIVDGVLAPATDGKYIGLKDLYDIWDQIDIAKSVKTTSDNLEILTKTPKRLLFNDIVLVLPPEMRPAGQKNGKYTKSELNTIYMNIIGLKSVTKHTTSNAYQIYTKFQNAVINLYTYLNTYAGGKHGFFQKHLLSKTTMWTVRNVISTPRYNSDNSHIGVFCTGYPLHTVCSMFQPIVKFHMKQFLSYSNIQQIHNKPEEINSNDLVNIYDNKMMDDLLTIYMKNPGSRYMIMYLDPDKTKPIMFDAYDEKKNVKVSRPLTLTDVVYLCCYDAVVVPQRKAYFVRFPIGDYIGAFFTNIHILSTNTTTEMKFQGRSYDTYPDIDINLTHGRVATNFAETVTPSNSRLQAVGGDYDGDTVKSVGIWSDESNAEADRLMRSKIYNIKMDCSPIYEIDKECINGLFALTKKSRSA